MDEVYSVVVKRDLGLCSFYVLWNPYLFKLCTIRVNVAIGIRPLGFLDSCSTTCHVASPFNEDRSLHVFSSEYKSPSLRPVSQVETIILSTSRALKVNFPPPIWHPHEIQTCLTRSADSERCQGPAKSQQTSVLGAESLQAVSHQLAQRLRQVLEALLQLGCKGINIFIRRRTCKQQVKFDFLKGNSRLAGF